MGTIDMRKFEDVRPLVRTRLLSSEVFNLEQVDKEQVSKDMYRTYFLALPAPDGCAPWNITYTLLEEWPGVTIDVLRSVAEDNMARKEKKNDVYSCH